MRVLVHPKPEALHNHPRRRRVLVICGDTQVGLWAVRSLGRAGLSVFCVGIREHCLSARSRFSSGTWLYETPFSEEDFVDEALALARELDVGSVMPLAERFHLALVRHRHRFDPDFHLFCPPDQCFLKATDKDLMHDLALKLGVPVARGTTLDKFVADPKPYGLAFPLVLRTRRQQDAGGTATCPWKAAYARDEEELHRLAEAAGAMLSNVLVQEYQPGVENHVQVLMHDGHEVMACEYQGEHHMPLAGGVTVQRVTCRHEDVIRDAVRLLQAIGWEGIAGVQFHYDPATGKYIFLEINPRFIGGLPTVIMAGFDAPYLLWQSHFEPEKMQPTPYRLGLRTRILGGAANWMLAQIRGDPLPPGQKRLGKASAVARFLWNCGPWTRDDTFWWRDPKPFWVDLRTMARKLRERSVDIIGNPETRENTP